MVLQAKFYFFMNFFIVFLKIVVEVLPFSFKKPKNLAAGLKILRRKAIIALLNLTVTDPREK